MDKSPEAADFFYEIRHFISSIKSVLSIQIHAGNYVGLSKNIKTSKWGDIFIKLNYFITFSCILQEDSKII